MAKGPIRPWATSLPRPMSPNSPQWAIGSTKPGRSTGRPLLPPRKRADVNRRRWFQMGECLGSGHDFWPHAALMPRRDATAHPPDVRVPREGWGPFGLSSFVQGTIPEQPVDIFGGPVQPPGRFVAATGAVDEALGGLILCPVGVPRRLRRRPTGPEPQGRSRGA